VLCTPGTPDKGGNADKCKTSTDGPVCVTGTDNSNFCGCQIDSDCSTDKKSGKVCDSAATLKCIDGCRGTGGNGCPDGLVCTSKDSSLGKCVKDSTPETTDAACSDGKDNDGDGKVDCDDPDCKGEKVTVCAATKESSDADCADGKDNDGNGLIDCKDPNCIGSKPCPAENTNETCSDGKDNDNDGLIDCSDPDCKSASITVCGDENTDAACKDGKDNDGDGLVDCKDPNCSDNPKVTVCPTPENSNEKCSDKMDNDGDGKVDCDDSDCNKNPAVTVCAGNVGNGGAGGAGGAGGKGGAAGMAGGVDTGTPVGNGDSADVAQDGGCGCVVAGKEPAQAPGNVILAAFAGLAALVSRRRSRR
jgi:MYXO-CTERM domain-containing protein